MCPHILNQQWYEEDFSAVFIALRATLVVLGEPLVSCYYLRPNFYVIFQPCYAIWNSKIAQKWTGKEKKMHFLTNCNVFHAIAFSCLCGQRFNSQLSFCWRLPRSGSSSCQTRACTGRSFSPCLPLSKGNTSAERRRLSWWCSPDQGRRSWGLFQLWSSKQPHLSA